MKPGRSNIRSYCKQSTSQGKTKATLKKTRLSVETHTKIFVKSCLKEGKELHSEVKPHTQKGKIFKCFVFVVCNKLLSFLKRDYNFHSLKIALIFSFPCNTMLNIHC